MSDRNIFRIRCINIFRKLILLELNADRYGTFFRLDLFCLGLVCVESYIIKKGVLCCCKDIAFFLVLILVKSFEVFCCLFFRKGCNAKISIIRNGISLLECCSYIDLVIFIFIYALCCNIVNIDRCYAVCNIRCIGNSLYLSFAFSNYICGELFFTKFFDCYGIRIFTEYDTLFCRCAINLCIRIALNEELERCLI